MALSDRLTYRAVYSPIKNVKSKGLSKEEDEDKNEKNGKNGKTKNGKLRNKAPLTIFNKATLIATAFLDVKHPPKLIEYIDNARINDEKKASLLTTAKSVSELLNKNGTNPSQTLKEIAKIDGKALLDLISSVNKEAVRSKNYFASRAEFLKMFLAPSFGYLYLERLRFTPVDTTTGELLYTLSLAPGEEVTLIHKTWAKTKREFTDIVENLIERNVTTQRTESLELSESTQSQFQFSAEMSSSFQGSGTIGAVELGGSASTNFNTSYQESANESTKRTMQLTEQATARSKQEHKVTFQVSSEAGIEDESRRIIRNPNRTHTVQYDYFRRMRKWRVDLERYGIKLMMDVMISDPGYQLRSEFLKRRILQEKANGVFSCNATASDIDESNLPPGVGPKPSTRTLTQSGESDPRISDSSEKAHSFSIPSGYEIKEEPDVDKTGGGGWCELRGGPYKGATGTVSVMVHRGVSAREDRVSYTVKVKIGPTSSTLTEWESGAVHAICLIRQQEFEAQKVAAQTELDSLTQRTSELPTILLRKDERQEIMRGVSQQLLLPSNLNLEEAPADVVRFVHEAFEWENMTYFLYPYYWKTIPYALEIDHPDILRRDFLRAGWARVLVPVRPGYEKSLMAYAYTGSIDGIAPEEMRSVAQQITDEAEARFPFQPSPEGGQQQAYEIINTWYDYTPTDGIQCVAHRGQNDIAEPALAAELLNAEQRRIAEANAINSSTAFRSELVQRMQSMPTNTEFSGLETNTGDKVTLKS